MATLIDASVLIALERGTLEATALTSGFGDQELALSAITASELLHGVHRARSAVQRHRREAFVEALLAQFPVVPFDLVVARVHASLWAGLARRGVVIGERDLLIGATALARDMALATRDARSFPKIPGLSVQLL